MLEKEEKKKRKRKEKIEIYLRQYLISFIILIKYNIFIYFLNRKLEILIKSSNRYLNTWMLFYNTNNGKEMGTKNAW